MRIPEKSRESADAFEPIYRALAGGSLADIDAVPGFVVQRLTVVSIWTDGAEVLGELRHVIAPGSTSRRGSPCPGPASPSWQSDMRGRG